MNFFPTSRLIRLLNLALLALLSSLHFSSVTAASSSSRCDPHLGCLVEVSEWSWLGPFVTGKNELDGDPVEAHGGIRKLHLDRLAGQPLPTMYSEYMAGGTVQWAAVQRTSPVAFQIAPNVDWGTLVQVSEKRSRSYPPSVYVSTVPSVC